MWFLCAELSLCGGKTERQRERISGVPKTSLARIFDLGLA